MAHTRPQRCSTAASSLSDVKISVSETRMNTLMCPLQLHKNWACLRKARRTALQTLQAWTRQARPFLSQECASETASHIALTLDIALSHNKSNS